MPEAGGDGTDRGRSGPPTGVIVGAVLAGAALLVVVALSIPLLLQQLQSSSSSSSQPPYTVGDCVIRDGDLPREADCGDPEAYEVVLEVDDITECPDHPTEPAITVSDPPTVYCLSPAATGTDGSIDESTDGDESDDDE